MAELSGSRLRIDEALLKCGDEDLVKRVVVGSNRADISDVFAAGREYAGLGARCRGLIDARCQTMAMARAAIRNEHAVVGDVGDEFAVSAPRKGRLNVELVVCQLVRFAAARRDRPELHDASVVAHQEGNARTVGRTAEPVPRALQAGEFAVSRECDSALLRSARWCGAGRGRAGERGVACVCRIVRNVDDEDFRDCHALMRNDVALESDCPSLARAVRPDVPVCANPGVFKGFRDFI